MQCELSIVSWEAKTGGHPAEVNKMRTVEEKQKSSLVQYENKKHIIKAKEVVKFSP